jgi:hypothetical protein
LYVVSCAWFGAKLIDAFAVAVVVVAVCMASWAAPPRDVAYFLPIACILGFFAYTVIAEYRHGRTLGKRLFGIVVVRESGARISLGRAFVRQLPFFGHFFFIDALFALFTDRCQRAFELLSQDARRGAARVRRAADAVGAAFPRLIRPRQGAGERWECGAKGEGRVCPCPPLIWGIVTTEHDADMCARDSAGS